ncbi:MAG: transposase [Bacteroidales bacterium]|nr:transposase [Bacteroidales bacterium]
MRFFMITTDHLCGRIWFRDGDDFRAAMNYVAIVAVLAGVKIVAFVLMSNHVHFVVACGDEARARAFIDRFKGKYGLYFWHKYHVQGLLRSNNVDIRPLTAQDEGLERAIAYVQMNPVAAGLCQHASLYPWGSGNVFFNLNPEKGRAVKDCSVRTLRSILHCREKVPSSFVLRDDGVLLPYSYISVSFVENLFRSSKRYNFFLATSSKARARLEKDAAPVFLDKNVLAAAIDLCRSLFDRNDLSGLSRKQLVTLLEQLRYRFGSNIEQLVRITGIPYPEMSELLEEL